jgi:hypothetical protein
VIDLSGGGESNPAGAGLAPLQLKLRRVKRDDAWVLLERLPEGGHQIKSPVRSSEGFHHTREPLRTTLSGTDFGSCRGLGAETEPFWGPDSCPPQDVVVVLAPSPSGPQDVGELHQSNSTLVNDSSESLLTWDFEWLGALQRERQVERVTQTHALGAALPTENAQNVATVRRSRRSTAPGVNRTAHACGLEEE